MSRISMIVSVLESTDKQAARFSAVTTLTSQFASDKEGFQLAQEIGGTTTVIGTVVEMIPALRDSVPVFAIPTNAYAGTITFLKIVADIKGDRKVQAGDIISLVGNAVGVAIPIAVLAGATAPVMIGLYAASTIISTIGLFDFASSDFMARARDKFLDKLWNNNFRDNPSATYSDYYVAPDMTLASSEEIKSTYGNKVLACEWNPKSKLFECPTIVLRESSEGDWNSATIESHAKGSGINRLTPGGGRYISILNMPGSRPRPEPIGRVRVEPLQHIHSRCSPHFRSADPTCNK